MQKSIILVSVLIISLGLACGAGNKSGNLLKNPGFEEGSGITPVFWNQDIWTESTNMVTCRIDNTTGYESSRCAVIENKALADAKLTQFVNVKPNSLYKLSAYIKAENIPGGNAGANVSVLTPAASESLYDTKGEWKQIALYGRTGPKQTSMEIAVRLGGFSSVNTGKAYFDKVELVQVQSVPLGTRVADFYDTTPPAPVEQGGGNGSKGVPFFMIIIFSVLYIFLFAVIYVLFISKAKIQITGKNIITILIILLSIGFIARMVTAPLIVGFQNDVGSFKAWSNMAASMPFSKFYADGGFFDYPPGSIYLFAGIGYMKNILLFSDNSAGFLAVLKFPSILCDIITTFLIFWFARKKLGETTALGLSILYLFNPCVFINSAVWGQVDSIAALMVFLVIIFIVDDRLVIASMVFVAAVMVKWQSGFLIIALLFALIRCNHWKTWVYSILCGLGTLVVIILPFNQMQQFTWIFAILCGLILIYNFFRKKTVKETIINIFMGMGALAFIFPVNLIKTLIWLFNNFKASSTGYSYATINAFNVFSIMGGNWAKLDGRFLGLNFANWGIIFAVLIVGVTILLFLLAKKEKSAYYVVPLVFIAMIFMLYIVMHERYLYPVLFLSLMSYAITKDKKFAYIFIGFSITNFTNVAYILDLLIREKFIHQYDPVMIITAWANLAILLFLIYAALNTYLRKPGNAALIKGK